jgi:hypothetical protein
MTTPTDDPVVRTVQGLRRASREPCPRYRTKAWYRLCIPARDRAFFERAWLILLRRGELTLDREVSRPGHPNRYIAQ